MFPKSIPSLVCVALLLLLMIWVPQALAVDKTLAWNAPTTHTDGSAATDLAGYHLYSWQGTGTPQLVYEGSQTSALVMNLAAGATYMFAVAAYNTAGNEGVWSDILTVTIESVNSTPSAVDDTASATSGTATTITVLANDTDADGNLLLITDFTQGAHGSVTRSSSSSTSLLYTPATDYVGPDSFAYTVSDGQGASATATVTVTVLPGPAASLVAAYNFNEGSGTTVSDASGHNNMGTISGATWTTGGRYERALLFNGPTARVTIPDTSSLRLTTAMTLEAWVYPTVKPTGWRTVVEKNVDGYYLVASS